MSERTPGSESRLPKPSAETATKAGELSESERPTNRPPKSEKRERNEGQLTSEGWSVKRRMEEAKVNEDSLLNILSPDGRAGLFAVADGIGGDAGGAEASKTALEIVKKYFPEMEEVRRRREAGDETATVESEALLLQRAIREANARIVLKREEMPQFEHMGTTCVSARVTRDARGNSVGIIAHAGDSRAYALYPDGRLETLTLDDHLSFLIIKKKYGEEAAMRVQDILDAALGKEQMQMLMEDVKAGRGVSNMLPFKTEDIRFLIDHMDPGMFEYYYKKRGEVFGSVGNIPSVHVKIVYLPPGSRLILGSDGLDGLTKQELMLIADRKYDRLPYQGVREAVSALEGDHLAQALVVAAKYRQGEWRVHPRSRGPDDTTAVSVDIS